MVGKALGTHWGHCERVPPEGANAGHADGGGRGGECVGGGGPGRGDAGKNLPRHSRREGKELRFDLDMVD